MNMKKSKLTVAASVFLASTLLVGCGTVTGKREVLDQATATQAKIERIAVDNTVKARDLVTIRASGQDVQAPWIAGKSIPLAKEVSVPLPLRKNVRTTMLSQACVNATSLNVIGACITEATGVAVRVKPDARLPFSQFAPRSTGSAAASPVVRPTSTAPPISAANGGASPQVFTPQAADTPLIRLLDTIASAYDVSYRLTSDGTLEFYRLDTRTFRVKALAQRLASKITQSTGFDNNSTTSFEIKDSDALGSIRGMIFSMGTLAGTVAVTPETKAITVTDTPEVLDRIGKYLDDENKRLTRRVTLVVDQFYVSSKNNREFSIDWSLVYGALGSGGVNKSFTSPGSLATDTSGGMSFSALGGNLKGSSLLIKALNQEGLVVQHRSFPMSTQNGVPVSIGLPTIFDYVQKVTFTQIGSGTGTNTQAAPSVEQKEERIGTYLTITPEAQDDGQVIVSSNFQDRTGVLNPYTVSAGGFSTTIQQRNIDEISSMVRTVMRVGVPTVIGGMSEIVNTSKERRLDESLPLVVGGSDAVNKTKRSMILVVTAIAEDGL
jgi:type IVB pilus formation R64 PilN family outer membrane protein